MKETSTELILKLAGKTVLLAFGVFILAAGLLAVIWIRPQPLRWAKPEVVRLVEQQSEDPNLEPQYQSLSTEAVSLDLAGYIATLIFDGKWLFFLLGLTGLLVGGLIVISPANRSQVVTFDKPPCQIVLTQPGWFFRSKTETFPFKDISEVRVERDRTSTGQVERNYRVSLVFSHSEGAPLSPNYVHYKTVFPFSHYQYDYRTAHDMAHHIQEFLKTNLNPT